MAWQSDPRCPTCGQPNSVRLALSLAPKHFLGLLRYSTGVVCSACGSKLRIVQRSSAVAVLVLWAGVAFTLSALSKRFGISTDAKLVSAVLVSLALVMLTPMLARRFVSLKLREGIDTVDFPVERLKDQLSGKKQEEIDKELEARLTTSASWVCPHCGEPNPTDCSVCIHCGHYDPNAG